MSTRGK